MLALVEVREERRQYLGAYRLRFRWECRGYVPHYVYYIVSSRLDYCNAIHVGLNQTSISHCQLMLPLL